MKGRSLKINSDIIFNNEQNTYFRPVVSAGNSGGSMTRQKDVQRYIIDDDMRGRTGGELIVLGAVSVKNIAFQVSVCRNFISLR